MARSACRDETAICVSSGESHTWFGEPLEEHEVLLPELDALVPVVEGAAWSGSDR
jgi:uncharacterized RmlC-like cupin family protein